MEHMLTNRSFFDDSDDPDIFDQEGERLEKAVYNGGMSGNWEKVISLSHFILVNKFILIQTPLPHLSYMFVINTGQSCGASSG